MSSMQGTPASSIFPMALRHGALASNKPHPAEKSTSVWLAIWRTWAGFANSQMRRAAFRCTYSYICVPIPVTAVLSRCSDIANLSAHLHRVPTPPPYLRQMRLSPCRGRRYPISDKAAVCPGRCSSKSPSTDAKVNYLVIRYLYFRGVRGGLDLSSSSTSTKVNCLVIRHLHFWSVRGDLQEGHGCSSRCQFPFSLVPIPVSRAQKRDFCALLAFGTLIFGRS